MNIIYIPSIFYNFCQTLFVVRVSSWLSSFNDASVDIADDKGSFVFSPKADTEAEPPLLAQLLQC